jgi:hypothetical protein
LSDNRPMNPKTRFLAAVTLLFLCSTASPVSSFPDGKVVWEIGKPDRNNSDLALAPDSYRQFKSDGFFVAGESDPKID